MSYIMSDVKPVVILDLILTQQNKHAPDKTIVSN